MPKRMRLRERIALRRAQAAERRRPPPPPEAPVEIALRKAGSIGALERLAGIGLGVDARREFWKAFSHLPANECLDAGCGELRRRVRAVAEV